MILIFQRVLAHYKEPFFKRLYKETGAVLCIGKKGPKGTYLTQAVPDFSHEKIADFYPFPKKKTFVFLNIFAPLIKYKPKIIITEFALGIVSNYLLFLIRPILRYKIVLWSHGYNKRRGFHPENSFLDKLRVWLMNRADAVLLYSEKDKNKIKKYLKCQDKVFAAPNTLDTERLTKLRNQFEQIGIKKIKEEMQINEEHNLIYIGRLIPEKDPEMLVRVFSKVSALLDSVCLHIVGDGPLSNSLRKMSNGLNIKFWGSISEDIITGKLLYLSDLMVMPGCLGLSIVHSFCYNTPVVSQKQREKGPFHGPEISYLENGATGFLVNYGDENQMAHKIIDFLKSEYKNKEKITENIRQVINNDCSIENMLDGFDKIIKYLSKEK